MATYKVIQDIEAEDKFVGPLTLKQFVFAMFGALFGYLSFFLATKGLAWGIIVTLPPSFFGFFMAIPWSSEQPTDVWVLAKIRFRIKPKKRIWDQSGLQELVTITAPKKEEKPKTRDISQAEVKSHLKALADTIDSRGWVIKNADLPNITMQAQSDRLINPASIPQPTLGVDTAAIPDMMEQNQAGIESMMEKSDIVRKAQLFEKMDSIRQGKPLAAPANTPRVAPPTGGIVDEQLLSSELKARRQVGDLAQENMHSIPSTPMPAKPVTQQPASSKAVSPPKDEDSVDSTEVEKAQAPMTEQVSPDILELARNNDLNVSTIARQANKETDEVVISLH